MNKLTNYSKIENKNDHRADCLTCRFSKHKKPITTPKARSYRDGDSLISSGMLESFFIRLQEKRRNLAYVSKEINLSASCS